MSDGKFHDVSYPLSKVLPWVGAAVLAVAAGTFALTRYATEQRIAALEHDISLRDGAIQQLKATGNASDLSPPVPQATIDASSSREEARSLLAKINDLESEKIALVSELAKYAKDALDPKSELFPLVTQLDSSSEKDRVQALDGLFGLRDARCIPHLVAYYNQHTEEATRHPGTEIWRWFNLLFGMDRQAGIAFTIDVLTGKDEFNATEAYEFLRDSEFDANDAAKVSDRLREVALRNKDALTRTRAKLLLQYYESRNRPGFQKRDDRSLMDVLLDIESDIKKLTKNK
jgi:hypothetical protein